MNSSVYSHCAGSDKVPLELYHEVISAIQTAQVRINKGASPIIRSILLQNLISFGWSSEVSVSSESGMTITSMKGNVGLCIQTGNTARMYADLLKLQKLYADAAIASAIMIVPSQEAAKQLGKNIVNGTRLERELEIFQRVVHVPMLLFVIE